MSQTKITRKRWHSMRARCNNDSTDNYKKYGGAGITYHPDWDVYQNFLDDLGECPFGYVLDRIDGNFDYVPGNCRWVTKADSAKNRSTTKLTYEQARTIKMLVKAKNPDVTIMHFSRVVASVLGLTVSLVRDVARGKSWESV